MKSCNKAPRRHVSSNDDLDLLAGSETSPKLTTVGSARDRDQPGEQPEDLQAIPRAGDDLLQALKIRFGEEQDKQRVREQECLKGREYLGKLSSLIEDMDQRSNT